MAEQAVEGARHNQLLSWARAEEGYVAAVMGERERASAAAAEASSLAAQLDTSFLPIATHGLAAATFLETGEPDRALEPVRLAGSEFDPGRHALLLLVAAGADGRWGGRRWRHSGSGKPPRWRSRFRCRSRATGSCSRRPR